MHYTYTTPTASPAAHRPTPIDDALLAEVRRMLPGVVAGLPFGSTMTRGSSQMLFAGSMAMLCSAARQRGTPIEKLIIAIKLAWASLPEVRLRLGESSDDAMSGAISACIEAYFGEGVRRVD
jgi:hypothetical protein